MKKSLIIFGFGALSVSILSSCKGGGGGSQDKYYTVTFNSQGGSEIPSQRIKEGEHASKPSNPTRGDDVFNCWVLDPKNIQEFNFESTPITCDITLYAHYYSDYTLDGITNIDYNENVETKFSVVDKEKKAATGFKYGLYVNDVESQEDFGINEDTGLLHYMRRVKVNHILDMYMLIN